MKSMLVAASLLSISVFCFAGCEPAQLQSSDQDAAHDDDHVDQHDHDGHDHEHGEHSDDGHEDSEDVVHGINNGHVFAFEPAEFRGEWLHYNDNDIVRVFILDKEGKKNLPTKVDSISVRRSDDAVFTLDPENSDDDGLASIYSLEDKELTIAMNLGVTIEMKIGETTYAAKITPHKPHKH